MTSMASLGSLPPELKAQIVKELYLILLEDQTTPPSLSDEINDFRGAPIIDGKEDKDDEWEDAETDQEDEDEDLDRDINEVGLGQDEASWQADKEEYMKKTATLQAEERSLRSLALVNREFAELSFPWIWKEIDFEDRSAEAILHLIKEVLPRHGRLVESFAFGQSDEPLLTDDYPCNDDDENEIDIEQTPEKIKIVEEAERLGGVGKGKEKELPRTLVRARRARSLLIAKVIEMCPNIQQLDCEAFQKHPIPEDAYEEDEVVMDPTKVYRIDHALEAVVKHLGSKLADLSLLINEDEISSETDVANVIKHCPNLLRLNLEVYCQSHGNGGRQALHSALLSLNKLETLDIATPSDFINDEFVRLVLDQPENPYPSLACLALVECNDLSFPSFISLIERFSPTLRILDIDNTPHANHPRQTKKHLGKPFNLPNLKTLVLSTAHESKFLQSFINCKLVEFTLGFCPSISHKDVEDFIIQHSGSLKKLEIASDAALSQAQVESLEVFCHAKGINCELLEPDESDGEEDDDPSDFGVDDDDEGGWYDEDGEEDGILDMVDLGDFSDEEEGAGDLE